MSDFNSTKYDRQCPICGDLGGNCRTHKNGEIFLCMENAGLPQGTKIENFVLVKEGSLWATFKLDDTGWTVNQKDEWLELKRKKQISLISEFEKEAAASVPVEERDRLYRDYLSKLELSKVDREELTGRGLTDEEIEAIGFKSVRDGYLIPVRGMDGIIGCQKRLRGEITEGGRYRWLSNKQFQPHIYINGRKELPFTIFDEGENSETIVFVEGVGSKPYLAQKRFEMPVFGFAGGNALASIELLKEALKMFVPKMIVIVPDAGDVINPHVVRRIKQQIAWLQEIGLKVAIAWWGQIEKNTGDIDEIGAETTVGLITSEDFLAMVESVESVPELDEGELELQQEINELLELESHRLPDRPFLPDEIEEAIALHANLKNSRRECFVTALLTGLSSLMNPKTRIRMGWDFIVNPTVYSAIVAESSQGKSPILRAVVSKPLTTMQIAEAELHKSRMATYEDAHEEWVKAKGSKADEPIKPERRFHFVTDATSEACDRQTHKQPDHGFLILSDELKGYFNSQGQYKNGNGSDAEKMLTRYDGTAEVVLRVEGGAVAEGYDSLISILGGVQPRILKELMKNGDEAGKWARFMFVYQPLAAMNILLDPTAAHLRADESLSEVYTRFERYACHEQFYRLVPEAGIYFKKAQERLEELRVKHGGAIGNAYGKAIGRIGKLALLLHCLHYSWAKQEPPEMVDILFVKMAVQMVNFYHCQFKFLFQPSEELSTQMVAIANLANRRKGEWISARDAQRSLNQLKSINNSAIQNLFKQLANMGKGEVQTTGRGTKFRLC